MTGMSVLHAIFTLLCLLMALFFCFRLASGCRGVSQVEAEHDVGQGMMAIGMLVMLAPAGWFSADRFQGNMLVFAAASLWWTCRLVVRKQRFALLVEKTERTLPSDLRSGLMPSLSSCMGACATCFC